MNAARLIDNKQRLGAFLLLAFSIAYFRLAISIPLDSAAADEVFSARTLPVGLAVATILLSLMQLCMPADADDRISVAAKGLRWRPAILLVLLMAGYALTFDFLGFLLASVAFLQAGFMILGERRIVRSFVVSAGLVIFMWLLLTQVFGLFLDDGAIYRAIYGAIVG